MLPRFTRVLLQPGVDAPAASKENFVASNGLEGSNGNAVHLSSVCSAIGSNVGGKTHGREEAVRGSAAECEKQGGSYRGSDSERRSIGQEDFDRWLRDLLLDMQTSIERHVAGIFEGQRQQAGGKLVVSTR